MITPPVSPTSSTRSPVRDALISLTLLLGVAVIYGQTYAFSFVNYDDNDYIYENPVVRSGLNWATIRWAFITGHAANWHPLTWISHGLDISLFGLWAGGHHLVAAGVHAANAILLFAFLRITTSRVWPSAFVAALFAWHPLRAESVAWVAERKDVLSTFFALLSLIAYAMHARCARAGGWYVASLFTLACSLMSKGMFVTMPFLMLLLDVWPLRRIDLFDASSRPSRLRALLLEKLPVFGVVLLAAMATFAVQSDGGTVMSSTQVAIGPRVLNAIVSVVRYVRMSFAPYGLSPYYPHPYAVPGGSIPMIIVVACLLLLTATSAVAIILFRKRPYVTIGWFWFLGTLVPVIGIVQVGNQALADRYTYVPGIGLAIAVVWMVADVCRSRPMRRIAAGVGGIALIALGVAAYRQVGFWRDSLTIMQRGVDVVPDSFTAHNNLGVMFDARGQLAEAEREYRRSLALFDNYSAASNNLASLLLHTDRADEAKPWIDHTLAIDPRFAAGYVTRAEWRMSRGERDAGFADYQRAVDLKPDDKRAQHNFALALALEGQYAAAKRHWRAALSIEPDYVAALDGYGRSLLLTGETAEAYRVLRHAIALNPADDETRYVLAWSLATNADPAARDPNEAAGLAYLAVRDAPGEPRYVDALAAAKASAGRFDEAATLGDAATKLAAAAGNAPLASAIRSRADLYRAGKPYVSAR